VRRRLSYISYLFLLPEKAEGEVRFASWGLKKNSGAMLQYSCMAHAELFRT